MSNNRSASLRKNKRKPQRKKKQTLSKEDIIGQIYSLIKQADEAIKEDKDEIAQKLANQARKLQMRTRVKFPTQLKKRFCKHCKSFLYPGINCRVRLSSSNKVIAILCFNCNQYTRIPYYKRKEVVNEGYY